MSGHCRRGVTGKHSLDTNMKVRTERARIGRPSDSLSRRNLLASLVIATGLGAAPSSARAQSRAASPPAAEATIAVLEAEAASAPVVDLIVDLTDDAIDAARAGQARTTWQAASQTWLVRWSGLSPATAVVPVFRSVAPDGAGSDPALFGTPLTVDAMGEARLALPRPAIAADVRVNGVATSTTGPGSTPQAYMPPVAIGGWILMAQDCSYAADGTARFTGHVARVAIPPEENNATTLWAVVTDEVQGNVVAVHTQAFAPASLPVGGPGVEVTCEYELPDGHSLRLRVFAKAPSSAELGSGLLLWEL